MNKRLKGQITIKLCAPSTSELIHIIFEFEGRKYSWLTSWRRGSHIAHSLSGEVYNVSFTDCGNGVAKNVRVITNKN
jgi:hypothetical protein